MEPGYGCRGPPSCSHRRCSRYYAPAPGCEGDLTVALYMIQFAYTPEAWAALTRQPEDRPKAFAATADKLGARLLNLYFAFGDYDGVIILEAPDEVTAASVILAAISP